MTMSCHSILSKQLNAIPHITLSYHFFLEKCTDFTTKKPKHSKSTPVVRLMFNLLNMLLCCCTVNMLQHCYCCCSKKKKAAHSWNRKTQKPIFSENENGPFYMKHRFLSEHLFHLQTRIIILFLCPMLRALSSLSTLLVNLTEIRTKRCRNVH